MKRKVIAFSLMFIFCFTIFTSLPMVSAAEGDTYDSFDAMPNYRWVNETTTTNTEENLDYGYTAYTQSLTTGETGDYAKSRKLLTRDTTLETRFQTSSTNSSYLEFFRDQQNDTCDFYEDTEGWAALRTASVSQANSILTLTVLSANDGMAYSINNNYSVYHQLEFRARANEPTTLNITHDAELDYTNLTDITTSWASYSLTVDYNMSNQNRGDGFQDWTFLSENASRTIYFDYIELYGSLTYNNTDGTYTAAIPEVPGYWTNTSAAMDHEFTINGDFEDDAVNDYYYDGSEQNGGITGWDLQAGFDDTHDPFDSNIGSIENGAPDGSQMFQHSKPDTGDADNKLYSEGDGDQWLDFTWVEGVTYMYNISVRYDDLPNDDDKNCYNQFTIDFRDDADMWIMFQIELNNYNTGRTNTTAGDDFGRLYWVTTIAKEGDTGWLHYSFNMTELFELMEASDTQAERESLTKFYMQYRNTAEDGTEEGLIQCDNWLLYNMTAESNVWTPAVPEVAGYWNYTYSYLNFTNWELSGQKFSWLTDDGDEGFYIKFYNFGTMYESSTYQMQAIFLDSLGLPFYNYTNTFVHNPREYLRLDVNLELDAMEVSLELDYDNGSEIFDLDLFDFATPTSHVPLLFETSGLPTFCINNTVQAHAHSFVRIDFIDTEWHPRDFREPDDFFHQSDASTYTNGEDADWDSISPYGLYSKGSEDDITRIYQLNVDNFDGLSFDFDLEYANWDEDDEGFMYIYVQGVERDGSLTTYGRVGVDVYDAGSMDVIYNFPGTGGASSYGYSTSVEGEISFDFTPDKVFSVTGSFDGEGGTAHRHELSRDPDPDNTGEFVFTFFYHLDNDEGVSTDDEIDFEITNFQLVQRFIGGIIAAAGIVVGFLFLASFLLALWTYVIEPIFIWLAQVLTDAFAGIWDVLGDVPILGDFLGFLTSIASDLGDFLTNLWADIQANLIDPFVTSITDALQDFTEEFIGFIGGLASIIIDAGADLIFFLWDDVIFDGLTPPDLIELASMLLDGFAAFIGGVIEVLEWVLEMMEFLGTGFWIVWLLVWAYVVLITALQTSGGSAAVQWIEGMSEKAMKNVSPGSISIPLPFVGSVPIIPGNIPLLIPLLIGTAIELGTWDALIAWVAP